jgi:hypothetical protein
VLLLQLMPMTSQVQRALAAAALLTCVLSGCGSADHQPAAPEAAAPIPPSAKGKTPYPLDGFRLSQSEAAVITQAAEAVLGDCMKQHGFQAPPYVVASTVGETERRYGITDLAIARMRGYHPGGTGSEHQPTPPPGYDTAAYQAALGSVEPSSGCLKSVGQKVGVGQALADGDERVYRLDVEAFTQAQRSPAVRRSIAAWSSCLRQKGITATDPLNAGATFTKAAVTQAEIAQAMADIRCKSSAGLVAVWTAQEVVAQRAAISAHQADLNHIRAAQLAVVAAARKALQQ